MDFWGKILGSGASYWVAESQGDVTEEQEELKEPHEPRGKGVNTRNFWVTTDLVEGRWRLLPLVTQRQMMQSRELKYTFSGDFERKIVSAPAFSGLEKHYVS